jgi:MSHA biogenesis protein MshL
MQNISSNDDAGLPGVSDIPAVGSLFKQQSKRNNRSELVILLRPIVVGSNKTWSDYIKDSANRMEKLNYANSAGE